MTKRLCGKCRKPKGAKGSGECRCGRPTDWRPEFVKEVDRYIAMSKDEFVGDDSEEKVKKVRLPTRRGFAAHLDVTTFTLDEWAAKYPEFSRALLKIDNEQEQRLLNSGLSGAYNSTIAKLILSSNHGYAEKSKQEHSGDLFPIPIIDVRTNDGNTKNKGNEKKA